MYDQVLAHSDWLYSTQAADRSVHTTNVKLQLEIVKYLQLKIVTVIVK